MIYYAVVFLVVGLVAGLLNLAEGSLLVLQTSWMLFLIGVALMAMNLIGVRTPPVRASKVGGLTVIPASMTRICNLYRKHEKEERR